MGLNYLWPLIFLVLIPLVILLYIWKQRAKTHMFSSILLWQEAFKNVEASTPWERLKHNLLLYLQILVLFFMVFAMAAPFLKNGGREYGNALILIDNSGSMNGIYKGRTTRLAQAKEQAEAYVKKLKGGTKITVATSAQTGKIIVTNTEDKRKAIREIRNISPTDRDGNLAAGVELLSSMVKQYGDYLITAYTDSDFDMKGLNGYAIDCSSTVQNAALEYVSHSLENDGSVEVLAKVSNKGNGSFRTEVNLYFGEEIVDIAEVSLREGESKTIYFQKTAKEKAEMLLGKMPVIKAEINEKDGLEEDNAAYTFLHENAEKKVLLVTEQNTFLEKAIAAMDMAELFKTNSIANTGKEESFDLYIYDGVLPDKWPEQGSVLLVNPPKGREGVFEIKEKMSGVWVEAVKKSALTEYITDLQFGCNKASVLKTPSWGNAFLQSGKNAIGIIGTRNGQNICILGFDLHESNLALKTEFPILMYHVLQECLDTSFFKERTIAPGEALPLSLKEGAGKVEITDALNQKKTWNAKELQSGYTDTERAGLYHIELQEGGENVSDWFSVAFPVSQSLLKSSISVKNAAGDVLKESSGNMGRLELKIPMLILALLLLLGEWFVYQRRSG